MSQPRRVLLTGASGFLGRHVQPHLLARGFEVHALNFGDQKDWAAAGVEAYDCNLLTHEGASALMEQLRPTHLLHLAWTAEPGIYWETPDNLRWVAASLNLLLKFQECGGQRAVIAGSCAEYDWNYPVAHEAQTPLNPASLYGISKNALRAIAEKFAENSSISLGWGRLFFPYGPHEPKARLIPSVIRALLRGEPALCTHGRQVRDFIYIDDAAAALAALLDSSLTGPVNIASGEPRSLKEIVSAIAGEIGQPELIQLGALEAPAREVEKFIADITRLKSELNFTPSTGMHAGLRASIDWWRNR